MKKYIEKAIKKGLYLLDSGSKITKVFKPEWHDNSVLYLFAKSSDPYIYGSFKRSDYKLIKAVFKSLFGEELAYCDKCGSGNIKDCCKRPDAGTIGRYEYHLKEWITSDLTPKEYLDKYYKD